MQTEIIISIKKFKEFNIFNINVYLTELMLNDYWLTNQLFKWQLKDELCASWEPWLWAGNNFLLEMLFCFKKDISLVIVD